MADAEIVTEITFTESGATELDATYAKLAAKQATVTSLQDKMKAMMDSSTVSVTRTAQSSDKLANAYARIVANSDPVARATQLLQTKYATIGVAVEKEITTEEAAAALRNKLLDGQIAKLTEVQAAQLRTNLGMETEAAEVTWVTRLTSALGLNAEAFTAEGSAAEFAGRSMETAGELAKGLLVGIGAGIAFAGLAELPGKIMETVEAVSKIGENAETIGTTTKNLQELDYAAQQSGVSTDTMNDALTRFTKNVGLAQAGSGQLAKILKANGIGITGNTLTDLENYANLIEHATTAEQRNVLTTAAFGKGASGLGNLFTDGADGIARLAAQADNLNVVLADGTIVTAHQLNQEFQSLESQLNTTFEGFMVNIAPALEAALSGITLAVEAANAAVMAAQWGVQEALPVADRSTQHLEADLATQQANLKQLQQGGGQSMLLTSSGKMVPNPNFNPMRVSSGPSGIAEHQAQAADDQAELDQRGAAAIDLFMTGNKNLNGGWGTLPPATVIPKLGSGTGGAQKALDPFQSAMQSVKDDTAALAAQQKAIGKSAFQTSYLEEQTKLLNDATKNHTALTAPEITAIDAASKAYAAQKAQLDALNMIYQTGQGASQDFFSQLKSDLMSGTSLWGSLGDAASKALNDIADKALSMASDGIWNMIFGAATGGSSSSSGGFLGSLLGMIGIGGSSAGGAGATLDAALGAARGLAGGGSVYGPGTGTSDSIPAMLSNGEFIVNADAAFRNRGLLEAMNSGAAFVHRATGGLMGLDRIAPPGAGYCSSTPPKTVATA